MTKEFLAYKNEAFEVLFDLVKSSIYIKQRANVLRVLLYLVNQFQGYKVNELFEECFKLLHNPEELMRSTALLIDQCSGLCILNV